MNTSFKTIIYFVWPGCWILMCFILGSGLLEFGEFCQLAAKFLVEEDEEGLKKELKEAFRIYDKEGIFRRSVILKAKFNYILIELFIKLLNGLLYYIIRQRIYIHEYLERNSQRIRWKIIWWRLRKYHWRSRRRWIGYPWFRR